MYRKYLTVAGNIAEFTEEHVKDALEKMDKRPMDSLQEAFAVTKILASENRKNRLCNAKTADEFAYCARKSGNFDKNS